MKHVVKQGEHISRIAEQYGFLDHTVVWDDADNAELKGNRRIPEILFPGDVIVVPDKRTKTVSGATGMRHRFVLRTDHLELRMRVRDLGAKPVANAACTLAAGGDEKQLVTDANGVVSRPITRAESQAVLAFDTESFDISIGELDPVEETTGWQARLINLGYLEAPVRVAEPGHELPDEDRREILSAIEEFECDHDLPLTGDIDGVTRAKLLEVHGC